ncbi:MAG: hypothetical protein ACOX4U_04705 [Anaerovoracaceae bacterium]|jgi:hypothetical protein
MYRKIGLTGICLSLLIILAIFSGCQMPGGDLEEQEITPTISQIPEDVQTIMDSSIELAANYALDLDREYADKYKILIDSGLGKEHTEYGDLKSTLDQFRNESGAHRVYLLTNTDPEDCSFVLTIESSDNPRDWMTKYMPENEQLAAWGGMPAASMSAWEDDGVLVWSAFAPVHTSDDEVIAILGIDYPAPIISEYPQWNRDSDKWNGAEY